MRQNDSTPDDRRTTVFWLCAAITIVSAMTSLGFSLVAVANPGQDQGLTLYAASRSVALAVAIVFAIVLHSRTLLIGLAFTMSGVQAMDSIIGIVTHDLTKTIGPAVFAIVNSLAATALLRQRINNK